MTKEATWIHHLLLELYSPLILKYPITLYCNNTSAIELIKNVTFYLQTKHIMIHYHYIHKAYNNDTIVLDHHGTDDMPTDIFTKALNHIKLNKFIHLIGFFQT